MKRVLCGVLLFVTTTLGSGAWADSESGRIVFTSSRTGNWELWTANPDGSNLVQLTHSPEEKHSPAWSPNGAKIAYSTNTGGIWVRDAGGGNGEKVSLGHRNCDHPAWHPDGKHLVFVAYEIQGPGKEDSEIWQVELNGEGWNKPTKLFSLEGLEVYPAWAPQGRKVAFSRFHRGLRDEVVEEIWIRDLATDSPVEITRTGADNIQVAWSPAGEALAFTSDLAGNYDVWVLGLKQGYLKKLTEALAYDGEPCWSADGTRIAFVSTRSGSKKIWMMKSDGSDPTPLTSGPGDDKNPCWSRTGRQSNEPEKAQTGR